MARVDRIVVHPDNLAEVLDAPEFVSVFKYGVLGAATHDPGELGRFGGVKIFTHTEAPRARDLAEIRLNVPELTLEERLWGN